MHTTNMMRKTKCKKKKNYKICIYNVKKKEENVYISSLMKTDTKINITAHIEITNVKLVRNETQCSLVSHLGISKFMPARNKPLFNEYNKVDKRGHFTIQVSQIIHKGHKQESETRVFINDSQFEATSYLKNKFTLNYFENRRK